MIYCCIIQSNINYSILACGFDCTRLVKLQKKIIRIISSSSYNAHTEPLFKKMKLLKLNELMKLNTLKFFYKLKNHKVPVFFEDYQVLSQGDILGRDTRYNTLISSNVTRTYTQQKCLRNYLPKILNITYPAILEKNYHL